jgi:hypothetical protein
LESKVFLSSEALGEINENCGFLLFMEEIREEPRQASFSFS